jgi:putative endonuclease
MKPESGPSGQRTARLEVGQAKERLAESFLLGHQLRLLVRNHRCRFGEIDLVMQDGQVLVFVEVRYRRSTRYGTPAETVDSRKRRRLVLAARHYLQTSRSQAPCRFDVVAIHGQDKIHWIRNAFVADGA